MKKLTITDIKASDSRLLPDLLGDATIARGGLYIFKPGEIAHPSRGTSTTPPRSSSSSRARV